MSHFAYKRSIEISKDPFDAIIMAAMRNADDNNISLLKEHWPAIWEELHERYNAPGGLLPDEIIDEKTMYDIF